MVAFGTTAAIYHEAFLLTNRLVPGAGGHQMQRAGRPIAVPSLCAALRARINGRTSCPLQISGHSQFLMATITPRHSMRASTAFRVKHLATGGSRAAPP